jgi:hypothetical protein
MVKKLQEKSPAYTDFFRTGRLYYRFVPVEHSDESRPFAQARGFDAFKGLQVDGFLLGI